MTPERMRILLALGEAKYGKFRASNATTVKCPPWSELTAAGQLHWSAGLEHFVPVVERFADGSSR